ncbi:MAG: bifunctional diguanylate cyclase/phosphodiesterase [Betaproteobacteria bacterium]|nr:bifunctional diguanylate cyclase/phosphodiesterase [Betaproteobacteria bacterium]
MSLSALVEAIEMMPDAVLLTEASGKITAVNDEAVRLTGYSRHELLSLGMDVLIHDQPGRRTSGKRGAQQPSGSADTLKDITLARKDGSRLVVGLRSFPVKGQALVMATLRDASRLRAAQQRARWSEDRFRGLARLSSDWYWEQDENLRFTYFSKFDQGAHLHDPGASLGKTRFELPFEWESEETKQVHRAMLEQRLAFRDLLLRDPKADRWILVCGEPRHDDEGQFAGYRGVTREITHEKRDERALKQTEERFRHLTELASDWYWEQYERLLFTFFSGNAASHNDKASSSYLGKTRFEMSYEWESEEAKIQHATTLENRRPFRDLLLRDREQDRYYLINGDPLFGAGGLFTGYRGTGTDVTQEKRAERSLRQSEERFRDLAALSSDFYWEQDAGLRFTYFPDNAAEKSILPVQDLLGKTRFEVAAEFESEQARQEHWETLQARKPFRDLVMKSASAPRWISVNGKPIFDEAGAFVGYRGTGRDITQMKIASDRSEYLATRDQVTGLPNRALLNDRLHNAMSTGLKVGVLFIDLDRFKNVNDTLGHETGDNLLREVARRLEASVRREDTVARLGGDEFVVVLKGVQDSQDVSTIASKLSASLAEPLSIDWHSLLTGASVGIAVFPEDGGDAATLIQRADTAMYQAKAYGRGQIRFFSQELAHRLTRKVILEREFRHALEQDELLILLQPQLDVRTQALVGAEVLVRWQHPERGLLPPKDFIGVAEETWLIIPMGEQVLRKTCEKIRTWIDQGFDVPRIAVNVSARQFAHGKALLDHFENLLVAGGLDGKLLEFEITESMLAHEQEQREAGVLWNLAAAWAKITIDDFGTGYSCMSYLRYLPIHAIKIDRSFIEGIEDSSDATAIVRAIIALARSLGLTVTAEGVESEPQLQALRELRCDNYQGFLATAPIPPEEFLSRYLKKLPQPSVTDIEGLRLA